jgi:hypothetical protein
MMPVSMPVMMIVMHWSDVSGPDIAGHFWWKRRHGCSLCRFASGRAYEA